MKENQHLGLWNNKYVKKKGWEIIQQQGNQNHRHRGQQGIGHAGKREKEMGKNDMKTEPTKNFHIELGEQHNVLAILSQRKRFLSSDFVSSLSLN